MSFEWRGHDFDRFLAGILSLYFGNVSLHLILGVLVLFSLQTGVFWHLYSGIISLVGIVLSRARYFHDYVWYYLLLFWYTSCCFGIIFPLVLDHVFACVRGR